MSNNDDQPTNKTTEDNLPWQAQIVDSIHTLTERLGTLADANTSSKNKETNWKTITRVAVATIVICMAIFYVIFYANFLGFQSDPRSDAVAFVPIKGPIAPMTSASAEKVVPLIERACNAKHVAIVVLDISSGGGAPSEADRINAAIANCKKKTEDHDPKKVYAMMDGVAASAAYMIAMKADKIYAGQYTIVGSIGAIIRYNDLSGFVNKHGVKEISFKTAPLKGGVSMFSGSTPEDDKATQTLVDDMGKIFLADVLKSRKGKLKIETSELYSGKIWTAKQALDYGLIDAIATREELKETEFKGLDIHDYATKSSFVEGLGFKEVIKQAILELKQPIIEWTRTDPAVMIRQTT